MRGLSLIAALVPILAGGTALLTKKSAHAEDAEADKAEVRERCAVRLSIALLGQSPDSSLLSAKDPQASVDSMIGSSAFVDRFANFINSELNSSPSDNAANEPVYYLARQVISEKKPWTDLFIGQYDVRPTDTGMEVVSDPNGVGYFRSQAWRKKYAGNDEEGTMLVAAFRMTQNTTGLTLTPSVGEAGEKRGVEARKADACKGCHFDSWYAIDIVARLLDRKNEDGTLTPRTDGPQQLLGKTISSDKEYIETLVASDAWKFNQCRRVYKFLYGRPENQCEAKTFDACVDALKDKKTIQAAVATVAKDPSFCTN
jgi:hypothetical protein